MTTESPAAAHPLDYVFHPRSVAIVGVSSKDMDAFGGIGFLRAIRAAGFPGPIYPVNPKATEVEGLRCYPSLPAIEGPVDYVISSVPARAVASLMDDAIAKGVKVIHFFTAGFSETGDEDLAGLEQEVLRRATEAGIRLIGPNCMGLYVPRTGLAFMYGFPVTPGHVALISQSGANAGEFVNFSSIHGVRFSKVVSFGNALDLNAADFFDYCADDPDTHVICAYLEGVKGGPRFVEAFKKAAARKPVIVLKGGRTEAGTRAASSHTGSLAGEIQIFDALCRQAGAIRVESLGALCDMASAFQFLAKGPGNRVCILGGGGGTSVLAADDAAAAGLEVPWLPESTQQAMRDFTPVAGTSVRNPVDVMAAWDMKQLKRTVEIAASAENIDFVLYHTGFGWGPRLTDAGERAKETIAQLAQVRDEVGKPIVIAMRPPISAEAMGLTLDFQSECAKAGFATFPSIERACAAMALMAKWQAARDARV
jgi:acyl-CoA synthetase (NDP forming)